MSFCGVFAGAFVLGSCGSDESSEVSDESVSVVETVVSEGDWLMARGGGGLSGQVGEVLPSKPVVRWTFKSVGAMVSEVVVFGDRVAVGDTGGVLSVLNLESGELVWKRTFEAGIEAAPAVVGDLILVGCDDGVLYALEAESGEVRWQVETDDKISAGVNVAYDVEGIEGGVLVILNGYDGVCRALQATDGAEVWSFVSEGPINGTPAVVDGSWVVFGGCDQSLYCLDLKSGERVRMIEGEAPIVSTVGTIGSFVAWGDHANRVVGGDAVSGEVLWVYRDRNFPFMGAPAVDDLRVYIGGRDKKIHAIDRATGELVWKFRTGSRVESSPILFEDGLVCGSSDGRLYALGLEKGEERWLLDLGESLVAAPVFARGVFLIGSEAGTLFALGAE